MSKRTIWDKVSPVYDAFEKLFNGDVFDGMSERAAEYIDPCDDVLECACGTGAISIRLAAKCRSLTATDMSSDMLRRCERKLKNCYNVRFRKADITALKCPDGRFDKVVAGNVIHLLPDPAAAVNELLRVCRPGGKVIIPTYISLQRKNHSGLAGKLVGLAGVKFNNDFTLESYRQFFAELGYPDAEITVVNGNFSCAVAVLEKP